ncbi:MAG: transposase [Verrucomicrobiales bacterium]
MPKRARRHFAARDKARIVRLHLLEKKPVSEICREEDITPTRFYARQKTLFEGAGAALAGSPKAGLREGSIREREGEPARKFAVIGELAQELVEAKKPLSRGS